MGRPRSTDNVIAWHRHSLPRKRKNVRLELQPPIYAKLERLAETDAKGRRESIVSVVERCIKLAPELLRKAG